MVLYTKRTVQSLEEHQIKDVSVDFWSAIFPVRKVRSKPVQGCTTNAKVVFEVVSKTAERSKSKRIEILLSSREVRGSLSMRRRTVSVLCPDR